MFSRKNKPKGINRLFCAFENSMNALNWLVKNETAFRQELVLFIALFPIAMVSGVTVLEKILLSGTLVFLVFAEVVNTAIETIVDRIGLEKNELSKLAKDLGSLSVLIALASLLVVWLTILI